MHPEQDISMFGQASTYACGWKNDLVDRSSAGTLRPRRYFRCEYPGTDIYKPEIPHRFSLYERRSYDHLVTKRSGAATKIKGHCW